MPDSSIAIKPPSRPWLTSFLVFLAIAVLGLAITHFTSLRETLNMDQMSRIAQEWGFWAPVFLFGLASVTPLLFLPRWPIAMICGVLYGVVGGAVLANICCTSGAWIQYTLAKRTLSSVGRQFRHQDWVERLSQNRDRAFVVLFFLRAFPFSNSVATNVLAGTLEIRNGVYLAATFFGMLPSTLMYAAWGKLLKRPDPYFYGVAVGILVVLLASTALAHRRMNRWLQADEAEAADHDVDPAHTPESAPAIWRSPANPNPDRAPNQRPARARGQP